MSEVNALIMYTTGNSFLSQFNSMYFLNRIKFPPFFLNLKFQFLILCRTCVNFLPFKFLFEFQIAKCSELCVNGSKLMSDIRMQ